MTTLMLVQKHRKRVFVGGLSGLTGLSAPTLFILLSVGAIVAVVMYLTALYATFSIGFQIQEDQAYYADLAEGVLEQELVLQQREIRLAGDHSTLLQSMETVSLINYITPTESVAVTNMK